MVKSPVTLRSPPSWISTLREAKVTAGSARRGKITHRLALPPRWRRALRLPALHREVALDAELRDLPVRPLEVGAAAALPDTGMRGVVAQAIDPANGAAVYAAAVDREGDGAAMARGPGGGALALAVALGGTGDDLAAVVGRKFNHVGKLPAEHVIRRFEADEQNIQHPCCEATCIAVTKFAAPGTRRPD